MLIINITLSKVTPLDFVSLNWEVYINSYIYPIFVDHKDHTVYDIGAL